MGQISLPTLLSIKFYWRKPDSSVYVLSICGAFSTILAVMSNFYRDNIACKPKLFTVSPFTTLALEARYSEVYLKSLGIGDTTMSGSPHVL